MGMYKKRQKRRLSQRRTGGVLTAVVDAGGYRLFGHLKPAQAGLLVECCSEDPRRWNDLLLLVERLAIAEQTWLSEHSLLTDADELYALLSGHERWLLIDLAGRRIGWRRGAAAPQVGSGRKSAAATLSASAAAAPATTSDSFQSPARRADGVAIRPSDQQWCYMTRLLPSWWTAVLDPESSWLTEQHSCPLPLPARRDVLWGPPMLNFMAERLLAVATAQPQLLLDSPALPPHPDNFFQDPDWVVAIHRDWLMSPCEALGGRIPRERLHIGFDWIERLVERQAMNGADQWVAPITAAMSSFEEAAPGRHEVILYFEACRTVLAAGRRYLEEHLRSCDALPDHTLPDQALLARILADALEQWWELEHDGQASARKVIDTERARLPLIDENFCDSFETDCPIDMVIGSGAFGPPVYHLTSELLDFNDEYAFSMDELAFDFDSDDEPDTAGDEAFDERRSEIRPPKIAVTADEAREPSGGAILGGEPLRSQAATEQLTAERFDSVWRQPTSLPPLKRDPLGMLDMAFRVAELQAALVSRRDRQTLVDAFRDYHRAVSKGQAQLDDQSHASCSQFQRVLEQLASDHPHLVSRSADLQSRVDEQWRKASMR